MKEWLISFLEYMLWRITEHQVIYTLVKKRRRKSEGRGWLGNEWRSGNFFDYLRKNHGILKEEFQQTLFVEEFGFSWYTKWLKELYIKLRPVYHEFFITDLQLALENCIKKGIIIETKRPEGIFIKEDTEIARKLLAWYYYPKMLLEYEPIRDLLGKVMKWVTILVLGYMGLSAIID